MTKQAGFNKLIAGLFVIGAMVGLYFQLTCHKFLNNDTLAYINLAELYASGDWQHAINGYWSPMYSWVLCLCHLTGLPLQQSCYVINFVAAGLSLYVLCKLAGKYLTHALFYVAFGLYALLLMLHYAMSTLTPDLMAAFFCFWFLYIVTGNEFTFNNRLPWLAGIVAACAYFSKSYNFVPLNLVLATWLIIAFVKKKEPGSKQLLPIIKTYGIFLFLSFLWIAILSIHENRLTFSTAGRFNHNLVGPDYSGAFPTNRNLYAPPFKEAYSIQINPAHLLDSHDWSPLNDKRSFYHQLTLINNAGRWFLTILDPTGAKWLILIASLLIIFIYRRKMEITTDHRSINKIGWFFVCYPLLYLPLFIHDRYVITCIILFHLLLFFFAERAWRFVNKKVFIPAIIILISFSLIPFVKNAQRKLTNSSAEYRYYGSFYCHLPKLSFLQGQSIASDRFSMVEAAQLSYHFKCSYFCTWTDEQYQSLKKFNIRFLIAKKNLSSYPFLHERAKLMFEKQAVFVYEVK